MNKLLLALSALSMLTAGCGRVVMQPKVAHGPDESDKVDIALPSDGEASLSDSWETPGDYVTVRLSGSYRDSEVTITQRIVERLDYVLVVDVTIDDAGAQARLRLRIDNSPQNRGELLRVSRLEGNEQHPMSIAAYENLMSNYVLAADAGTTTLGSTGVIVEVGGSRLPCVKTSYRVRVGVHEATMHTLSTKALPWANVGGEVVTRSGKSLFKAEIIDIGNDRDVAEVAAGDEGLYDFYED